MSHRFKQSLQIEWFGGVFNNGCYTTRSAFRQAVQEAVYIGVGVELIISQDVNAKVLLQPLALLPVHPVSSHQRIMRMQLTPHLELQLLQYEQEIWIVEAIPEEKYGPACEECCQEDAKGRVGKFGFTVIILGDYNGIEAVDVTVNLDNGEMWSALPGVEFSDAQLGVFGRVWRERVFNECVVVRGEDCCKWE